MDSFVELGLIGLFLASFLAATILPMNSASEIAKRVCQQIVKQGV